MVVLIMNLAFIDPWAYIVPLSFTSFANLTTYLTFLILSVLIEKMSRITVSNSQS